MASRGVVAAGHALTAEAGASILREGGNAVDAAVAAAMASFSVESALTGLGAGGFMMVGAPGEDPVLLDFFVAAPGHGGLERREELVPVPVHFDANTTQIFNAGAASCGVPGTPAGLAEALERFGSMELVDLIGPGVRLAREGAPLNPQQAYVLRILEPIYTSTPEAREIYAPEGRILGVGDLFRFPDLAAALERYAAEGPDAFYRGETAESIERYVHELGGVLSAADLAAYEVIAREPVTAELDGYETLAQIKQSTTLRHLPVIMISAVEEIDSVIRCIEMGATDYLPKPFNHAVLEARISASLASKKLRDLELEYLEQVGYVTDAAVALEAGEFDVAGLASVAARSDALGQLARVFQRMVHEVHARETQLKQQVQELRIEIDKARQAKRVAEITESSYFQQLRGQAQQLRTLIDKPASDKTDT